MTKGVRVSGITKRFGGLVAARDVSLSVSPGEVLAIVGPNGAGKSTVLAMIAGALNPDEGSVRLSDTDITSWPLVRRVAQGVSLLRQHSSPLENYTVQENINLAVWGAKRTGRFVWDANEVSERLGLGSALFQKPASLNHGGLRRLEFARVLAMNPDVLLLDEPFAGLGKSEIQEFEEIIGSFRARGTSIILVDHDVSAVERVADRVALMRLGEVIEEGAVDKVFSGENMREVYLGSSAGGGRVRRTPGKSRSSEAALEVKDLTVKYGAMTAVDGVSFSLRENEIVSLVGLNGAGKSSVCDSVLGLGKYGGSIAIQSSSLDALPPWERVSRGVAYVPEERALFSSMSVEKHLQIAKPAGGKSSSRLEVVWDLFPKLHERRRQKAGTMSGGEQQMLAIARALLRDPSCLIIDEPTLGLAPNTVASIGEALSTLADSGACILLCEQNVRFAHTVSDRYMIIRDGVLVAEGPGDSMLTDEQVMAEMVGR